MKRHFIHTILYLILCKYAHKGVLPKDSFFGPLPAVPFDLSVTITSSTTTPW